MMEELPKITTQQPTRESAPEPGPQQPARPPVELSLPRDQVEISAPERPDLAPDLQRQVAVRVDDATGRIQARSRDLEGETLREIPSDEFLEVMKNLKDLQGRFVDEQA